MARKATTSATWQNRIVGEGVERADQLLANPMNFRIHPKNQQDVMTGVLNQVGWVQRVIVNRNSGHIIDGHLRVSLAISAGAQDVPVVYVDLTDAEEALILATLDPISAMAATDADKLRELMELVSTDEPAIGAMLAALGESGGAIDFDYDQPELSDGAEDDRQRTRDLADVAFSFGEYRAIVKRDQYIEAIETIRQSSGFDEPTIIKELLSRLGVS